MKKSSTHQPTKRKKKKVQHCAFSKLSTWDTTKRYSGSAFHMSLSWWSCTARKVWFFMEVCTDAEADFHRMSSILVILPSCEGFSCCRTWATYKFLSRDMCLKGSVEKPALVDFPVWMRERAGRAIRFSIPHGNWSSKCRAYIKFLIKEWPYQTRSTECLEKKTTNKQSITILATTTVIA